MVPSLQALRQAYSPRVAWRHLRGSKHPAGRGTQHLLRWHPPAGMCPMLKVLSSRSIMQLPWAWATSKQASQDRQSSQARVAPALCRPATVWGSSGHLEVSIVSPSTAQALPCSPSSLQTNLIFRPRMGQALTLAAQMTCPVPGCSARHPPGTHLTVQSWTAAHPGQLLRGSLEAQKGRRPPVKAGQVLS